ncbi:reverse transcriptase domain-containing protein [Tanacetum coccineum]|uniref:Reverse transcriptase domain-containing protein n=1 Tax=Tanacetum coccineum TaxID=301880 RepID=A0ABQ4XF19_9ASTR
MEVKADDIVIKSNDEEEMLADIKETLDGLRAINMKLNPKKCSFGIEEGIFSGHLIIKQGIKASPLKVKAISDLQPPKSVGEICTSEKMFQWTAEADEAFRRMKKLLEALLTEAELGYLELEKLILALVYAARRLQRYFQAHLIQVLNDKPIKQILARLEKSGRIAKWSIELGEHEIKFRGINSVKGQILADFLAKTPLKEDEGVKDEEAKRKEPEPKKAWKLFNDRASSSEGSRAGLILVSPEGKEYTYALRPKASSKKYIKVHEECTQRCETCQIHSPIPRKPKQEMTAWPFSQWGIDIVGPLPIAPGGARFLVVAIYYFTK